MFTPPRRPSGRLRFVMAFEVDPSGRTIGLEFARTVRDADAY
jgi:hypothetical protein